VVAVAHGPTTLGALDRSGALSLATLDDEPASAPASDGTLPASMGPVAARPAKPARSRNEPLDPFAPPELSAAEPLLELAEPARWPTPAMASAAEAARRSSPAIAPTGAAGPAMTTGAGGSWTPPLAAAGQAASRGAPATASPTEAARWPATASGSASNLAQRASSPLGAAGDPADRTADRVARRIAARVGELVSRFPVLARLVDSVRARLAIGVLLAILLGFVPAHLVAGWRQRSAFAAIDGKIMAVQAAAATPDSYDALDAFRAQQLDAKYAARRSIVVTALLIWAAAGAALGYGWFSLLRLHAARADPDRVPAARGPR